jgi:hypothetical protein
MAGLRGDASGLESTRAAAGDDDATRFRRARRLAPLQLAPQARVDGAGDVRLGAPAVLHEAEARPDLRLAPLARLRRPFRVDEHGAAEGDEVRPAGREGLFREPRMAEAARNDHRHVHDLLHRLGEREREALVVRRVLDVRAPHAVRDRQVIGRRCLLQRVDDLERVVDRHPVGGALVPTQADADGIVVAAARPHLLDHLDEQPQSALERVAAVFVRAPVRSG